MTDQLILWTTWPIVGATTTYVMRRASGYRISLLDMIAGSILGYAILGAVILASTHRITISKERK
jgi:hypothetical protein